MSAKCGGVGGFIAAETGVPHQLEGENPGRIVQDTAVRLPNFKNQLLQ